MQSIGNRQSETHTEKQGAKETLKINGMRLILSAII